MPSKRSHLSSIAHHRHGTDPAARSNSSDMMSPSSSSLGTDVVNESSVVNTTTTRLTDVNATENYITINLIGRLGNRMFQYASFMGLARRTRRTPVLICERLLAPKYPRIAAECLPQAMAKPFGELPKRNKLTIHEV